MIDIALMVVDQEKRFNLTESHWFCGILIFLYFGKSNSNKTEWILFLFVWCQWRRSQFTYSIPSVFCHSHYSACYRSRNTLSNPEVLPSWNTSCNDLDSYHGCSGIQHCPCMDKCTISQLKIPHPISPRLFGFWNSYLWPTCWTTHVSLMVDRGEFMHNSNCDNIASLAPTNLSICLSVTWLAPKEIRSSSPRSFWDIFFDSWHGGTTK